MPVTRASREASLFLEQAVSAGTEIPQYVGASWVRAPADTRPSPAAVLADEVPRPAVTHDKPPLEPSLITADEPTGEVRPPSEETDDGKGRDQLTGADDGVELCKVPTSLEQLGPRVVRPSEPQPSAVAAVEGVYLDEWISERYSWRDSVTVRGAVVSDMEESGGAEFRTLDLEDEEGFEFEYDCARAGTK